MKTEVQSFRFTNADGLRVFLNQFKLNDLKKISFKEHFLTIYVVTETTDGGDTTTSFWLK